MTKRPTGGKNYALRNLNSNFSGSNSRKVDKLLRTAEDYMGTPYKFGGVTRSGMDCSGFITTVYDSQDVNLPRRSEDQSREGREISIKNVIPGDLLFLQHPEAHAFPTLGLSIQLEMEKSISFMLLQAKE